MRIQDKQLRAFTDNLTRSGTPKLDDTNVLQVLAGVGDKFNASSTQVMEKLTAPGMTRSQQLELAKSGLSNTERRDVAAMLDNTALQMEPGARNFLEALIDRAPLQETFGPLTIKSTTGRGIEGIAKPGETIEAINLSTAPGGRLHLVDTMVIGTADASGKFLGQLPDMKEGDIIRMRTRAADGSTSDWLTVQAKGVEAQDTRNALVNLERMDLAATPEGVTVTHNTGRPLTEPGAMLRFTNARTGAFQDVKATENGSIPAGLKLQGQAGDEFKVAVSDGTNNTDFATVAGSLKVPGGRTDTNGVDLKDPDPLKSDTNADGTPKYKLTRFTGPLFIDGAKPDDVRQGAIGNCYFPAALASVAHSNPEAIQKAIKDNGDGTYTVRFYENADWGRPRPVDITVDADLYARSFGGPVYGSSLGGSTAPDKMELWFPLIEKAYAQWKGGFEAIGQGGSAAKVMSEVLGKPSGYETVSATNADRIYNRIKTASERGASLAAGTYGTDQAARYANTGVYANHAYTVYGVEEKNGEKFVKLRNPWGQSEYGYDGKNDGNFSIPLSKFVELYRGVHIVE